MAINRNIRSISYVTIGLLLGKLTGFFKHFVIVKYFGITYDSDLFFVANTITEMAINIVLAGLLTGAFIPIASEILVKYGNIKFSKFVSSSFITIGGILLLASILLYFFSYKVGTLIAPGYNISQHLVISRIFKILSPGILFIGLAAILRGIMHVREDFLIPSFGLFIANGTTIFMTIFFYKKFGILSPAIGVSLGFFLWFLMQLPSTAKYINFKNKFTLSDEYFKKLLKFCIPAITVIFFTNIILIIEKVVASTFVEGTVTQLNLAFRLSHIFSSVLVIPLSTVVLPKMSKHYGRNDFESIFNLSKKSLKIVSLIMFPFLIMIILNSNLITRIIYGVLNLSSVSIDNISGYLIVYSLAIANLFLYLILQRIYYSIQRIKSLVFANLLGVISYLLIVILLKSVLRIYVLPAAYCAFAFTVIMYLLLLLKTKIFYSYPSLLEKTIFFYGFIFMIISLLIKFYLFNNIYLLLLFSITIVFLYLIIISKKESLSMKNFKENYL